ncbi:MAG: hypothetical protein COS37_09930, partial [Anaerolineae bacterium CG03_land_8_20_14_0_80_58_20]
MQALRGKLGLKVLAFSPEDYRLDYRPVSALFRHRVNSPIYRIHLATGRQVEITAYHSLFTLCGGESAPVRGDELRPGDYIAAPRAWVEPPVYIRSIDIIDTFLDLPPHSTEKFFLYGVRSALTETVKAALKSHLARPAAWNDFLYHDYLPFNMLRWLPAALTEAFKDVKVGTKYCKLPARLPVSKALIELLGLYAAEGCVIYDGARDHRAIVLSFGVHEPALMEYAIDLAQDAFGYQARSVYAHESARTVKLSAEIIAVLLEDVLRAGSRSNSKRVPDLIFNLPPEERERYLISYLSGDGYPSAQFSRHLLENTAPDEADRAKYTFNTASRELASGLQYLLASLGKTWSARVVNREQSKAHPIVLNYQGQERVYDFVRKSDAWYTEFYWNTHASYLHYVPYEAIVDTCSDSAALSLHRRGQKGLSRTKIESLAQANRLTLQGRGAEFLQGDLGLLKITRIEPLEDYDHEWVYDISVPDGENFVAGSGPIVCHNSIDEALAGECTRIDIVIHPDSS